MQIYAVAVYDKEDCDIHLFNNTNEAVSFIIEDMTKAGIQLPSNIEGLRTYEGDEPYRWFLDLEENKAWIADAPDVGTINYKTFPITFDELPTKEEILALANC